MAGIIGIYGLVVSVLISDGLIQNLPLYTSFIQLGAGLSVGLAGLAAGYVDPFAFTLSLSFHRLLHIRRLIPRPPILTWIQQFRNRHRR